MKTNFRNIAYAFILVAKISYANVPAPGSIQPEWYDVQITNIEYLSDSPWKLVNRKEAEGRIIFEAKKLGDLYELTSLKADDKSVKKCLKNMKISESCVMHLRRNFYLSLADLKHYLNYPASNGVYTDLVPIIRHRIETLNAIADQNHSKVRALLASAATAAAQVDNTALEFKRIDLGLANAETERLKAVGFVNDTKRDLEDAKAKTRKIDKEIEDIREAGRAAILDFQKKKLSFIEYVGKTVLSELAADSKRIKELTNTYKERLIELRSDESVAMEAIATLNDNLIVYSDDAISRSYEAMIDAKQSLRLAENRRDDLVAKLTPSNLREFGLHTFTNNDHVKEDLKRAVEDVAVLAADFSRLRRDYFSLMADTVNTKAHFENEQRQLSHWNDRLANIESRMENLNSQEKSLREDRKELYSKVLDLVPSTTTDLEGDLRRLGEQIQVEQETAELESGE